MSEHFGNEHHHAERADAGTGPPHERGVEKLAAATNIGLTGVPLAYVTSQSIVITLIAVVLAIAAVVAYLTVWQRR